MELFDGKSLVRRNSFSILEGCRTLFSDIFVGLPRIFGVTKIKRVTQFAIIHDISMHQSLMTTTQPATRTIAYRTMRHCVTCTAMAALALLASCNRVDAFAPPSVSLTRAAVHPTLEQFAKPFDSVESDDIETRMERIKQIHIQDGTEDSLVQKKDYNPTPVLFKAFQNIFDQKTFFRSSCGPCTYLVHDSSSFVCCNEWRTHGWIVLGASIKLRFSIP